MESDVTGQAPSSLESYPKSTSGVGVKQRPNLPNVPQITI